MDKPIDKHIYGKLSIKLDLYIYYLVPIYYIDIHNVINLIWINKTLEFIIYNNIIINTNLILKLQILTHT